MRICLTNVKSGSVRFTVAPGALACFSMQGLRSDRRRRGLLLSWRIAESFLQKKMQRVCPWSRGTTNRFHRLSVMNENHEKSPCVGVKTSPARGLFSVGKGKDYFASSGWVVLGWQGRQPWNSGCSRLILRWQPKQERMDSLLWKAMKRLSC